MATLIDCPSCRRPLNIPDALLGKNVQCPACGLTFRVESRPASDRTGASGSGPPAGGREERPMPPREEERRLPYRGVEGADLWDYEEQDSRQTASRVVLPAVCLLVSGILGLVADIFKVLLVTLASSEFLMANNPWWANQAQGGDEDLRTMSAVLGGAFAVVNLGIILASIQMLRRRTYGLVLAGTVLSMLNCDNGCCLLGLPFGIWALVILLKPEVKALFEKGPSPT